MALPLNQMTPGVFDVDIRNLVQAGMVNRCFLAYAATANADATIQAKRMVLCASVTNTPDRYVTNFAYMSLAQATITDIADYTATVVTSTINQANWDMMADLLISDADAV